MVNALNHAFEWHTAFVGKLEAVVPKNVDAQIEIAQVL